MDPKYDHLKVESKIYQMWENGGYFTPRIDPHKKPFTILLPPPNASGKMHTGNVLMIAIEDLLIRWHRMKGNPTLWVPGTDHAGIETQTTFERELKKQGKSRFDFDRQTLYKMIWDFVQVNKHLIEDQIRDMGASVDWSRYLFMLDPKAMKIYYDTFKQMIDDGLIYRGDYLVNYSFKWGTTFSDAEVHYIDRIDPLYFVKYKLVDEQEKFIEVATVRPELIIVDTHLAINPKDRKHQDLVGKRVLNPLSGREMEIFADSFVDPKFGTGIVKLTPGHDKADYQVALTRKDIHVPIVNAIDWNGRLNENTGDYKGLTIKEAREKAIKELTEKGLLDGAKTKDDYTHQVPVDIRSDDYIENLILPNWFIKVDHPKLSLKQKAYEAVKSRAIKIYPKWREVTYLRWIENLHDWAISRQNVWGIRIPAWYNIDGHEVRVAVSFINKDGKQRMGTVDQMKREGYSIEEIKAGLQRLFVPTYQQKGNNVPWEISTTAPENPGVWFQDTDTFDTWFSSGQWPLTTLGYPDSDDFKYFYPTSVMETGWEIVTRWISRMVMLSLYCTKDLFPPSGKVPFQSVYLHGHVRALDGRKMSKSLGNVIEPDLYLKEFGADALRMGMISGTAGGKDFNFPRDKVIAYRNFANKLWNIGRFILLNTKGIDISDESLLNPTKKDTEILKKLKTTIKKVNDNLEKFRFSQAAEVIYQFTWHEFADKYVESSKERIKNGDTAVLAVLAVLRHVYLTTLKLLHPFMPFITEEIWQIFTPYRKTKDPLIISPWPKP